MGRSNIFEVKKRLEKSIINYVLPSEILKDFTIKEVKELGDSRLKEVYIELQLEEKNTLPPGYKSEEYESKGFISSKRVQDFPLRGKAVYLVIKRRRWRHKETKKEIKSDYSFISEGAKLTQELSDFLKGTGRYPRRYD